MNDSRSLINKGDNYPCKMQNTTATLWQIDFYRVYEIDMTPISSIRKDSDHLHYSSTYADDSNRLLKLHSCGTIRR